jgi:hypothetical protein
MSVRTIIENADKIRASAKSVTPLSASKVTKGRHTVFEKMETLLGIWIQVHVDKNMPVSFLIIKHKALSLFEDIKKDYGVSSTPLSFTASHGWFECFKLCCNLHNIKITGEAVSADKEAATHYPQILKDINKEGRYSPKQN